MDIRPLKKRSIEVLQCTAPNSTSNEVRNIPVLLPIAQASIIFDVLFATKQSVVNTRDWVMFCGTSKGMQTQLWKM